MELSMMTFMLEIPLLAEDGFFRLGKGSFSEEKINQIEEMISAASDAGFSKMDFIGLTVQRMGIGRMQELLKKYEMTANCLICLSDFANPNASKEVLMEEVKQVVDDAKCLNAGKVMLVPAPAEGKWEELFSALVRNFSMAVSYAKKRGIVCVIEDDPKINLPMCSVKNLLTITDAVPDLKIVYDTANVMMVHEDPAEDFRLLADRVEHMHLKDIREVPDGTPMSDCSTQGIHYVGAPHGRGIIDFPAVFRALKEKGYHGTMATEFIPDPEKDLRSEFCRVHDYFSELIRHSENPF